ncbi:hypothetical protein CC78DRAFT_539386 [Lojkania enalia]|uniref:Uncharacterized protein n=1 Tax=Lojkania enalia TaxID=147567 RepID=A0A9P4TR14_9PLEO|nr:hypothetical protein CC78DRAFT_539386 [Didymosphaeria enalia]
MCSTFAITILALVVASLAKTDLAGCTSSAIGASLLWYVPGTGEICSILDCGGGRAPPKTTVPGCAAYVGTATYEPSFLSGYGETTATAEALSEVYATSTQAYAASSAEETIVETAPATSEEIASTLGTITSAVPIGTGSPSGSILPSGNLTASATYSLTASPSVPVATGAANMMGTAKRSFGLAIGIAGLAIL